MNDLDTSPVVIAGEHLTQLVMDRLRTHYVELVPLAQAISNHCDVKLMVVGSWFVNPKAKLLGGISTFKLWYLLEQAGIPSPEIAGVTSSQPYGSYIGKLLAYDVIDMPTAQQLCGGTAEGSVLHAARGGQLVKLKQSERVIEHPVSQQIDLRAMRRALEAEHGVKLAEEMAKRQAELDACTSEHSHNLAAATVKPTSALATTEEHVPVPSTDATLDETPAPAVADIEAIVRSMLFARGQAAGGNGPSKFELAASFLTARVYAQHVLDNFSPEEQQALKRLVGADLYFDLKNQMAALSSTRAHKILSSEV